MREKAASSLDRPLVVITLRRLLIVVTVLLAFSILVFLARAPLLREVADALIRVDAVGSTDAMFVLGGDLPTRLEHAAAIHPRVRPAVVLVSPGANARSDRASLVDDFSLPADEVRVLPGRADSTYDEALALRDFLRDSPLRSVTIVTTSFHTARARWVFRRVLPPDVEIRMAAASQMGFTRHDWWKTESGLVTVHNELIKWVFYRWRY